MAKKCFTTEQIISKLREVEVLISQGRPLLKRVERSGSANRPIIAGAGNMGDGHRTSVSPEGTRKRECPFEETGGGSVAGQGDPERDGQGKLLKPGQTQAGGRSCTAGVPPFGKKDLPSSWTTSFDTTISELQSRR